MCSGSTNSALKTLVVKVIITFSKTYRQFVLLEASLSVLILKFRCLAVHGIFVFVPVSPLSIYFLEYSLKGRGMVRNTYIGKETVREWNEKKKNLHELPHKIRANRLRPSRHYEWCWILTQHICVTMLVKDPRH